MEEIEGLKKEIASLKENLARDGEHEAYCWDLFKEAMQKKLDSQLLRLRMR